MSGSSTSLLLAAIERKPPGCFSARLYFFSTIFILYYLYPLLPMLYLFQLDVGGLEVKSLAEDTTTLNEMTGAATLPGYGMGLPAYMIEGKFYPGDSDVPFASLPSEYSDVDGYLIKVVKAILYSTVTMIVFEKDNEVNRVYVGVNKTHTFNSLLQEAKNIGFILNEPYTLYYEDIHVDGESNVYETLNRGYELKVVVGT